MTYRDDIDGLRAIAVILIVFFHANLAGVSGGFIGVDVFFVISGFLITKNITRDLEKNQFSYKNFYMRRLRRLGPALLVTIAFTLLAGWFILPPDLYQQSAQSAIATIFSVSNIYFWQQAGYFDTASDLKPLLHTWSLAVEEQFYFIWPAIIVLTWRLWSKTGLLIVLAALSVVSLITGQLLLDSAPAASFFLTPLRMFEFGAGAFLAITGWQARGAITANVTSIGGLATILYVADSYSKEMQFPGLNAAIPALATALMLYGGPTAVMNRALAIPPIRYIGRISYSIYLVHWPLFIYYAFVFGRAETSIEISALLIAALGLGAILYHLVETPFRWKTEGGFTVPSRQLGWGSLIAAAVIVAAGWLIHAQRGFENRYPPDIIALLDELDAADSQRLAETRETTCNASEQSSDAYFTTFQDCLPNQQSNLIVVLGDSHAADVYMGLRRAYPEKAFVQLTGNGCNIAKQLNGASFCAPFLRYWQTWLADNAENIDAILYTQSARSLIRREAGGIERPNGPLLRLLDRNLPGFAPAEVPFFFFGPRPELRPQIDLVIPQTSSREALRTRFQFADYDSDLVLDAWLADYAVRKNINYISSADVICDPFCPTLTPQGQLFVVDYAHWSPQASALAVDMMIAANPELAAIMAQ